MDDAQFQAILEELGEVRFLLEILSSDKLRVLLEQVLTTEDRRRIWTLCNGSLSTKEIADRTGLTMRAVQKVVKELAESDLVVLRRAYPKRRFDFMPSDWRSLS